MLELLKDLTKHYSVPVLVEMFPNISKDLWYKHKRYQKGVEKNGISPQHYDYIKDTYLEFLQTQFNEYKDQETNLLIDIIQ